MTTAAYRADNLEKIRAAGRKYYAENREKAIAAVRAWQERNPEKTRESRLADSRKHYEKRKPAKLIRQQKSNATAEARAKKREWKIANPEAVTELHARRRAAKKNATPAWRNDFFIREAYHLAKLRTASTGFKWEVDHIIPLKSPIVCGLHVEHNLQVIPAVLNRSKGNKVIHHG